MSTLADTRGSLPRPPIALQQQATLIAIPVVFMLLGLVLRYAAYATVAPDASVGHFPDALCQWDCQWYVHLAMVGYDPYPTLNFSDGGNWAFFPLMPMVAGLLRIVTGWPSIIAGTVTSLVMSIVTARAAWPLFEKNLRAYTLFAAYLLVGPFSIYFTTFFTEAAFILLTVCVFVQLKRRDYLLAGVFAAFLSATRIVGVFIVFAIVVQAYLDHRERGGTLRNFIPSVLGDGKLVLAIFLAPVGCFLYMAFLYRYMGDGLAFQHVQRAWGRGLGNPLVYIGSALTNFPKTGFYPGASQELAIAAIIGLGLTLVLYLRRSYAAAVFCTVCLILPMFAGLASMTRFVTALAPLPLLANELLSRPAWLFAAALLGFFLSDYYVTIGWLTGALALV